MSIAPIVIDGEFTIERVTDLKAQFESALIQAHSGENIILDMQGLINLDGAGLQLLLAFSRALASLGVRLSMVSAPESLRSLLAEYGLLDRFVQTTPASQP